MTDRVQCGTDVALQSAAPEIPGFLRALKICFWEKYFSFKGRASRTEYWYCVLVAGILTFVPIYIAQRLFVNVFAFRDVVYYLFFFTVLTLMFFPVLSATIRRYHDVGLSGWLYILLLCCTLGLILIVYILTPKTVSGFGANPIIDMTSVLMILVNFGLSCIAAAVSLFSSDSGLYEAALFLFVAVNLFILSLPGTKGPNKYGPAPSKRA
jgi:uncharacterized membrane protein YhaH (DUF805 family)